MHCGGVVIVPDEIRRYVPVEFTAKGLPVIQWEKDQAEEAGLVKIDLLGNRSLAVIRDALEAIVRHTGRTIEQVDRETDRNKYMSAAQAREWGVIDEVVESLKPKTAPKPGDADRPSILR